MKKIVCYLATRNVYQRVVPSLKSLLKNGGVDQVYILAEDEDLGFDLPTKVIAKTRGVLEDHPAVLPDLPTLLPALLFFVMALFAQQL